ncbi:ESX secretion-associated protein EspG [Nocardia asteroides]|uniref:ESX secretion-associated protein EspG n=1 Tax=Nocardia asteroides TaxID=1824 RepID=UPI001E354F5D|nr:ESX secretion-associated protein EspG [Nocardia asteroides]UGT60461.1 ESX secretion-associated protein EspG [Nocardia asteroides]
MGWSFTPDEFAHVWRETESDRVPYPLRILESPRTEDAAAKLRVELSARLPHRADPDLTACLRLLSAPHTRIVVIGGGPRPGAEIRLLACAVFDHAVLVVQEPGRKPEFGGAVRLSIGHTNKLGARIAQALPPARAGRLPARAATVDAVRDEETHSLPPAARLIRKVLLQPHTAEGHIRIEARLDRPAPPPALHYTWIDVDGDGRYLIKSGDTVHLVPAGTEQLAAQLQKRIPA